LAALHHLGKAVAADFNLSVGHHDQRHIVVRIGLDAVAARAQNGQRRVGRINRNRVSLANVEDPDAQRALRQTHLQQLIRQVGGRDVRVGGKTNGDVAGFQFRAPVPVGVDAVARGERIVQ
jgi:hypothetical protein